MSGHVNQQESKWYFLLLDKAGGINLSITYIVIQEMGEDSKNSKREKIMYG